MRMKRRIARLAALAAAGGCLLQLVGCLSALSPLATSLAESMLYAALLGG